MTKLKRGLCLVLTLALTAALALPVRAADPLADSFAAFLIDAADTDSPTLDLHVELYRRNAWGSFQKDDAVRYDCSVNRTAGNVSFYVQPKTDGVWVEVDYLTDLDGNGIYEMLDGVATPVCDSMTTSGELVPWDGTTHVLNKGQTYILTGEALAARGQAALKARNIGGSGQTLPSAGGPLPSGEDILYFVSLHYLSPMDQEEYVLCYYLRLFDSVIVPSDVSPRAWYYGPVEYALEKGLFTGTGPDSFSPDGTVTRAQLAQILWRLGGSQEAAASRFPDVRSSDWYYDAVSWCSQTGLMSGTSLGFLPDTPLTREQLALVLHQYVRYVGADSEGGQSLVRFSDGADASSWARAGLEWAVDAGLLSGYEDGTLRPGNSIKRSELAAVLRTLLETTLAAPQDSFVSE